MADERDAGVLYFVLYRAVPVIEVTIGPNAHLVPVQARLDECSVQWALQRSQVHRMVAIVTVYQLLNPLTAVLEWIRVRNGVLVDPSNDGGVLAAHLRLIRLSISSNEAKR